MTPFRARQPNEDLGSYLQAKQAYELAQGGSGSVNFGSTPLPTTPTVSTVSTSQTGNPTTARGDQFFVMLANDPYTVFLYDKNRKVFVPFPSEASFTTFAGMTPEQAGTQIQKLNFGIGSPEQKSWGIVVPDEYGFGDDGHVKNFEYYQNLGDATGLDGRYGKTRNVEMENKAAEYLSVTLKTLVDQGAISQNTLNQYMNDPLRIASYINAWTYGGYNFDDIFRDIKAKELGLSNVKTFDPTKSATEFQKTPDYALAKNNQQLQPPINLSIDPQFFNNPIFAIPDSAFKTLVPVLDRNSPEFKEKASKIQEAYYDVLLQQLDATTAQAKTIADDNYRMFKDQVEKQYGIQLADNASSAWGQVQQLVSGFGEKGLADSGIFNEAQDRLLADRRKSDERLRDQRMTEEEGKKREYYLTKATPAQIQSDLTPEERQRWGLTPTAETLNFVNNIRATYPNLTDDQVKQYKNSFIDENGNLRSQLYQNLYVNKFGGVSASGAPVLGVQQSKELQQEKDLLDQTAAATEKAYAPYTRSDNPFIQYEGSVTPPTTTPTTVATNPYPTATPPQPTTNPTQQPSAAEVQQALNNPGSVYTPSTTPVAPSPTPTPTPKPTPPIGNRFYRYDKPYQGKAVQTVYDAATNEALDYNTYINRGGKADFSGIETRKAPLAGATDLRYGNIG